MTAETEKRGQVVKTSKRVIALFKYIDNII